MTIVYEDDKYKLHELRYSNGIVGLLVDERTVLVDIETGAGRRDHFSFLKDGTVNEGAQYFGGFESRRRWRVNRVHVGILREALKDFEDQELVDRLMAAVERRAKEPLSHDELVAHTQEWGELE